MTSTLRELFEYELYKILSLSNNKNLILNNTFLIYDTNKTGYVDKNGWKLTFKNLGLTNFNDKEFDILFYIYDTNNSGLINYFNFCEYFSNLLFNISQNNYQQNLFHKNQNFQNSNLYNINQNLKTTNLDSLNSNNIKNNINFKEYSNKNNLIQYRFNIKNESEEKKYFESLIQLLKNEINSNNMIYSYLSILLKNKQDPLDGTITYENFILCLNEAKINYSKINIKDFYQYLDIYNQNKVSIVEILNLLRGYLNDIRMKIIIEIFVYIDSERKNYIEVDKLKKLFNPNNHPYVILGIKNPNDIYKEFIFCLNNFIIYKGINNKISFDDFIEFFTGISATIKNDLIFNNMMNNIFNPINIFEKRNEIKNNLSNKDIKEINKKDKYLLSYENPIIKLKNNILSLGKKGIIDIEKQFYNNDIKK